MKRKLLSTPKLCALEEAFLAYAKEYEDVVTSGMVNIIIESAARAAGYEKRQKNNEEYFVTRAIKAVELLEKLPQFEPRLVKIGWNGDLPLTRKILWETLIKGMLFSYDDDFQELGQALLKFVKLSMDERKTLQETLKEQFEKLSSEQTHKLLRVLQKNATAESDEDVVRAMFRALARHGGSQTILMAIHGQKI